MANVLYPKGKEAFLGGLINLSSDTIKVGLLDNTAAFNSAHQFWSDVSAKVIGTPQTLASKTVLLGVFDGADVTFAALSGVTPVGAFVIYKDTGVAGTSPLIGWFDSYAGFPFTPSGADEQVVFDNGVNKIFAL